MLIIVYGLILVLLSTCNCIPYPEVGLLTGAPPSEGGFDTAHVKTHDENTMPSPLDGTKLNCNTKKLCSKLSVFGKKKRFGLQWKSRRLREKSREKRKRQSLRKRERTEKEKGKSKSETWIHCARNTQT